MRDALHGVPIGRPVHPLAAQVPLGAWVSSAFLDLLPGADRASRRLVALGVVSAVPAPLAGYTDWSSRAGGTAASSSCARARSCTGRTAPLPNFEARIDDGVLSVRLPGAG